MIVSWIITLAIATHFAFVPIVAQGSACNDTEDCYEPCSCEFADNIMRWCDASVVQKIEKELPQRLANLTKALQLETRNLTSAKLKKISAPDPRPSAKAVGAVGIVLLTVFFVGMLAMDYVFLSGLVKSLFSACLMVFQACSSKIHGTRMQESAER